MTQTGESETITIIVDWEYWQLLQSMLNQNTPNE